MRLAIMQPYFFPYLGHFSLIAACDEWVVFDVSQYTRRTWMNRNRVIDPRGGSKWVTVPLAQASMHIRTEQANILDPASAQRSVLGHLSHYRRAPHYETVTNLVREVFTSDPSLARLNVRALAAVCRYVGMPFRYRICSEMELNLPPKLEPGDWAREICIALSALAYVNPISKRALFDRESYAHGGIDLRFLSTEPFIYRAGAFAFETNLSILDVLMWNSPERVRSAIYQFTLT